MFALLSPVLPEPPASALAGETSSMLPRPDFHFTDELLIPAVDSAGNPGSRADGGAATLSVRDIHVASRGREEKYAWLHGLDDVDWNLVRRTC